jgi:2-polyprenyl-3-methyl-5-hydroxy-6-metoxy-1,4-benzoquinol methylase
MGTTRPSDELRPVYEERARIQYAEPARTPDPALDRKFAVLSQLIAGLLPCEAYIDAGCGDGRYLAALPALGPVPGRVVGTDIAESILETARRACDAAGVDAELVRANLEQLPFPDASFDVVVCAQVIEHLLDARAGLHELARVLRPGGTLLLTTDNRRMLITRVLNAPRWFVLGLLGKRRARFPVHFPHADFTREELAHAVRESGLVVEQVRTYRFSLIDAPPRLVRLFNRIDEGLPDVGIGDVLLVVARRALA